MDSISERIRLLAGSEELGEETGEATVKTLKTLARRTNISESKWRDFLRGKTKAGEEIVEAAAKLWPWYTMWMTTGSVPKNVVQKSPFSKRQKIKDQDDVILERASTPDGSNEINIPHALKLREITLDRLGSIEPLTSDTLEWGYFGAGPCELAANILFHFGVPEKQAIDLRIEFARDVIAQLDRNGDQIQASKIRLWINKHVGQQTKDGNLP